ncbi:DUF6934 family protein [Dyadobacter frigoris]|uniref:Uncharacterized protein n=1 Tax=Dyadobacter frigoris TaxID=2576211 RepID=A0A4U6D7B4_9BACT|nr:hypothetical protein [Dyadobacter frigoris]TKT92127.1 hypothetical protein FDK13_13425 [Dyadobacter frigoris]GLU52985.1 hypothetical protein Dfri01_24460 [Dyadobacter frigoris]
MNYKPYALNINEDHTRFQFQSIGKRGVFEKVILFQLLADDIYNLALLDYNPTSQEYSDLSVTNNGDMPEIFATVIKAVTAFLIEYQSKKIYFEGSTPSRTRLYQIVINKIYNSDNQDLIILGLKNEKWYPFERNIHFDGFLIKKKI